MLLKFYVVLKILKLLGVPSIVGLKTFLSFSSSSATVLYPNALVRVGIDALFLCTAMVLHNSILSYQDVKITAIKKQKRP